MSGPQEAERKAYEDCAAGGFPMIDPDCRDGKHTSCVGDPCECECHLSAVSGVAP
jgi:hypothetical protein